MVNFEILKIILLIAIGVFVGMGVIAGIVLAIVFSTLHAKRKKRANQPLQKEEE